MQEECKDFKQCEFSNVGLLDVPSMAWGKYLPHSKIFTRYAGYAVLAAKHLKRPLDALEILRGKWAGRKLDFKDNSPYALSGKFQKRQLYLLLHMKDKRLPITPSGDLSFVSFAFEGRKVRLEGAGFSVRIIKRPAYTYNRGWQNPHARTWLLLAVCN